MIRRRSPLVHLLLVFLLLVGQQLATAHAFEHDFEHLRSDARSTGHSEAFCEKCLAVAQLDHVGGAPSFAFDASTASPSADRPSHHVDPTVAISVRYDSRAPPRFS